MQTSIAKVPRSYLEVLVLSIAISCFLFYGHPVFAMSDSVSNNDFVFEASIKEDNIKDGTAPFDLRQESGYDVNDHNGIVRTFDTVTYPLKITINPKSASVLRNIKLKITGSLENGVTDHDRVNAVFSLGNKTDIANNSVTFEQNYTVDQTGNSVMLPITVEVKGAIDGLKIRPNINVEVISVDGVAVSEPTRVRFNDIPYVTTSGKVSIQVQQGDIYGTNYIYENSINPLSSKTDQSLVYGLNLSIMMVPITVQDSMTKKSDMRGSTAPDGQINLHYEMTGDVYWDNGRVEHLNFGDNTYKHPEIFALYPILGVHTFPGVKNTVSESLGVFGWGYAHTNSTARSNIYSNGIRYSVVDSGVYNVDKPSVTQDKVLVNIYNKDFVVGEHFPDHRADNADFSVFQTTQKAFSTIGIILKTPNEFAIGYGKNMTGIGNNTTYTIKVIGDSYIDKQGVTHQLNDVLSVLNKTERNNPNGSYSLQNSYFDTKGDPLGGYYKIDTKAAHGDSTIIRGQDIYFKGYVYSNGIFSLGGAKKFYYWNPDSFELTKNYADVNLKFFQSNGWTDPAGIWKIDNTKQKIYFGVLKTTDYQARAMAKYNLDDFNWYSTYDEAIQHGPISSMMRDINDKMGNRTFLVDEVKLRVKTQRVGSLNENGTENMIFQKAYVYPDAARSKGLYVYSESGWDGKVLFNASEYDTNGNLARLQSPVGSGINFDTLAIVNGNLSTSVTSDKNVYYSTDTIQWSVENRSVLPSDVSFNEGEKITYTQKLPNGLIYVPQTFKVDGKQIEPKIVQNADGSTHLIYTQYLSSAVKTLPKFEFQTKINPMVLGDGNQVDLTVSSVVSDPNLDSRSESFRTGTKAITVTKVGMVGVNSSITPVNGKRNSSFTLQLAPYTTIDDEPNVRGLYQLPENNDANGSHFEGSVHLKQIQASIPSGKTLRLYVSDERVSTTNPNLVDLSKFREVTLNSPENDLKNAKTLYYVLEGKLSKTDHLTIDLTMQTSNNNFGNVYYMKSSLNSDSEYKLSPESNKVKYEIVPDASFKFQVIRMYTDKASKGITGNITIEKEIFDNQSNDKPIDLVVYDKTTNKEVFRKTFKIGTIPDNIPFNVPSEFLSVNTHHEYEAKFEKYDDETIYIVKGYEMINVDGYTSSEKHLTSTNDVINYKGVIMTERVIGQEIAYNYEHLEVGSLGTHKTKTGYGIDLANRLKVTYSNELNRSMDIEAALDIDKHLANDGFDYDDGTESMKRISLTSDLSEGVYKYELPEVMVQKGTGKVALATSDNRNSNDWIYGARKLYIPVWLDHLDSYAIDFVSVKPVGINGVTFDSKGFVNVYAYMYATDYSDTLNKDEMLMKPEMNS